MIATMKTFPAVLLFAVLVVAGCAPAPVRDTPPEQLAERAESLYRAGDFEAAAKAWLEAASEQPDDAHVFRLKAAEAWILAGDRDRAESLLASVDTDRLGTADEHLMVLIHAQLALARNEIGRANQLLAGLPEELDPDLEMRRMDLQRSIAESRQDRAAERGAVLRELVESPDFEPELALALLIERPLAELDDLMFEHAREPDLLPWLDLASSARRHLLDDRALIESLELWEERHPAVGYPALEAYEWIRIWRQTVPHPETIAVLLPSSGPLAEPGKALRDGLIARWLEMPADLRGELDFLELDSTPESAVSAWFQALERGADFVIGPLERAQVDALAEMPQLSIPALFLNQPEQHDLGNHGMAQYLALPPEAEAEDAAIQALAQGHRRALLMIQDTAWGRRLGSAFSQTFEAGGGQLLDRVYYPADRSDHSVTLENVLGLGESGRRAEQLASVLATSVESVPSRRTDLDVIFLASRPGEAHQIKPQLRFFDAGTVPLFATSHVYAGMPDPNRDQDLDGTELAISPWFLEDTPEGELRRQAADRFSGLDSLTLSQLHALGRDAMALVPWLDFMRRDPDLYLPGAAGRLRLESGGRVDRDLPWARFENGRLIQR